MVNGHLVLSLAVILFYVAVSYLAGRLITAILVGRTSRDVAASAPLLGATALALELWAFAVLRIPWTIITLLLPWVVAGFLLRQPLTLALQADWSGLQRLAGRWRELEGPDMVFVAGALMIGLTYLVALVTQPVTGWDGIAMWLYKAKLFFTQHAIGFAASPIELSRHLDYPPLYSLMVDTIYTIVGRTDDMMGKGVNFLFLTTAAASCLALTGSLLGRRMAVIFTLLLVAMPLFWSYLLIATYMGYADYALGVLMMISLIHLYRVEQGHGWEAAGLALVFAAMAGLTKNEGLVFLMIIVAILAVIWLRARPRQRPSPSTTVRLAAGVGLVLIPLLLWQLYVKLNGFTSDLLAARNWGALLSALPGRASTIGQYARQIFSFYNDSPWLLGSYVMSALLLLTNRFAGGLAVFLAVSLQAASYFLTYLLSPHNLTWHLTTSFDRLVIQLGPSLVVLLAVQFAPRLAPAADQQRPA
jgi:hypothetical protein